MGKEVAQFYDGDPCKEFDRLEDPYNRFEFLTTLDLINEYFPKDATVCDIGSGPGKYALELLSRGDQVTLIDLSQELIDLARKKIQERSFQDRAQVFCANAQDLSMLQSEEFDCVLVLGPMYHLLKKEERHSALKEAHRVLKKGGVGIVAYLNSWGIIRYGLERFSRRYKDKAFLESLLGEVALEGCFENFTECFWSTPPQAISELEAAGFKVVDQAGCEGFAAGMKPAIRRVAAEEPTAYANICELMPKTARLPQYRDTAEHIHFVVTK